MLTNVDLYRNPEVAEDVRFAARRLALLNGLSEEFVLKVDPDKNGISAWESLKNGERKLVKPLKDGSCMTYLSGCVARSALADPSGYQGSPVVVMGEPGHDIEIDSIKLVGDDTGLQRAKESLSVQGEGQMDIVNTSGDIIRTFRCSNGIIYESNRYLAPAEIALKILIEGSGSTLIDNLSPDDRTDFLHLIGILDFVGFVPNQNTEK